MSTETKFVEECFDLLQDFSTKTEIGEDNINYTSSYEQMSCFFRNIHRLMVGGDFNHLFNSEPLAQECDARKDK